MEDFKSLLDPVSSYTFPFHRLIFSESDLEQLRNIYKAPNMMRFVVDSLVDHQGEAGAVLPWRFTTLDATEADTYISFMRGDAAHPLVRYFEEGNRIHIQEHILLATGVAEILGFFTRKYKWRNQEWFLPESIAHFFDVVQPHVDAYDSAHMLVHDFVTVHLTGKKFTHSTLRRIFAATSQRYVHLGFHTKAGVPVKDNETWQRWLYQRFQVLKVHHAVPSDVEVAESARVYYDGLLCCMQMEIQRYDWTRCERNRKSHMFVDIVSKEILKLSEQKPLILRYTGSSRMPKVKRHRAAEEETHCTLSQHIDGWIRARFREATPFLDYWARRAVEPNGRITRNYYAQCLMRSLFSVYSGADITDRFASGYLMGIIRK